MASPDLSLLLSRCCHSYRIYLNPATKVISHQKNEELAIGGTSRTTALGSRMRSSIPITPYIRRRRFCPASEHRRESQRPPAKNLPLGYQNRTLLKKLNEGNSDTRADEDMEHRIKALYRRATGGYVSYIHPVKGLDWELLKRIKSREDKDEKTTSGCEDEDDEFDRVLEEKEKEKAKKGNMPPPSGEMHRREPEPSESSLGSKFKRIGDDRSERKRWVEQDENGRRKEVLVVTDSSGKTKRKIRWLDKAEAQTTKDGFLIPDKNAKPLGMEVPADIASKAAAAEKSEDEDILEGAGLDYNPLAELSDDEPTSESEKEEGPNAGFPETSATSNDSRNYFSTSSTAVEVTDSVERSNPFATDPTILAALKRAAALRQASPSGAAEDEEDEDEEGGIREGQSGNKRKRGPKKRKGDKDNVADIMKVLDGRKNGDK
ncbi:hypothetical protein V8E54_000144 [Elaphomyces granulatus]